MCDDLSYVCKLVVFVQLPTKNTGKKINNASPNVILYNPFYADRELNHSTRIKSRFGIFICI